MRTVRLLLLIIASTFLFSATRNTDDKYKCLPCGLDCDKTVYKQGGSCPDCSMQLVKSSTIIFTNIKPSEICNYIKSHPNSILLDVRTKEEFEGKADPNFGTLKNAINIPIQFLDKRMAELDKYKDKEILVFCSHSHRSPRASYLLTQNGFKQVVNMSGGMSQVKDNACKK